MTVYTPLQNGQVIDAEGINNWVVRNGNYGTALLPMAQNGLEVDNSLDIGSPSHRWRKVNAGGVLAGTPVGSFTVPERKWARFALPAKDVGNYPVGITTFFSIDISALGKISGAIYTLTFLGDDWNFSTNTGTIYQQAQAAHSYTVRSGTYENYYDTFYVRSVNTTVEVVAIAVWGGVYTGYNNYFATNASNWDGTAQSRGWLDIQYTPI